MRQSHPRFSAVKVQGLVGHLPAFQDGNYRHDHSGDDNVFRRIRAERLLLDVIGAAAKAVSKVFDLRKSRYENIRHNGRFDKNDTHFDDPLCRRGFSFRSPAEGQIRTECGAASSAPDDELSVRFPHGEPSVKTVAA